MCLSSTLSLCSVSTFGAPWEHPGSTCEYPEYLPSTPCTMRWHARESVAVHADEWMKRPPKSALALPACMMSCECGRPISRTHSTPWYP